MLQVENLSKRFGKKIVLDQLNMSINKGELYGFVGPNGAGKTTALKIISGLIRPDSGTIKLSGKRRGQNSEWKRKIAYMPDFFGIYDNLKVNEYLEFYAALYGINRDKAEQLCCSVLEYVNFNRKEREYVDYLSKGMKQKLCLARCLLHDPELLILDEPASGLDAKARIEMNEILKKLNSQGKTILISSHILPDIAQICSNIGIIDSGKMILQGTVLEILDLIKSSNPLVIRITKSQEEAIRILKEHPLVENILIEGNKGVLTFLGGEIDEAKLLSQLINHGVMISYFAREEGNLESLFMKIAGNEGR